MANPFDQFDGGQTVAKSYDTALDPAQEKAYRTWMSRIGHTKQAGFGVDDNFTGADYDYRGFFKQNGAVPIGKGQHFTDEFKKPNHETFSVESKYAVGDDAAKAGSWDGETFKPPQSEQSNPFDQFDVATQAQEGLGDYRDQYAGQGIAQGNINYAKDYAKGLGGAIKHVATVPATPFEAQTGAAEAALNLGTAAVAPIFGGADYLLGKLGVSDPNNPTGSYAGARDKYIYQPRGSAGRALSGLGGALLKPVGDAFAAVGTEAGRGATALGASPAAAADIRAAVPDAIGLAMGARGMRGKSAQAPARSTPTVETPTAPASRADPSASSREPISSEALAKRYLEVLRGDAPTDDAVRSVLANSTKNTSAGAASAAAINPAAISGELRTAIMNAARRSGGAINPEVLARHAEADSLPVKVRLTEGQALQDPALISNEMNSRATQPELAKRFNEQNAQLADNIRAIRDEAGPDVFSANAVEHGDTLISAYKARASIADKAITAKYKELRDANGGQFPVNARALLKDASAKLHQQLLFDEAPRSVMVTLNRLARANNMTFENFESLRTNLARIQRDTGASGNAKAAAGVIRKAMESLPLNEQSAAMKPLADSARAAAKAQFDAIEADPAYAAAVDGSVTPDAFVRKFVIAAPRDAVAIMRENLADNQAASQTIGVATLDHLRQAARIDSEGRGNFSQAGYNKALEQLGPKLNYLLDPKTAEHATNLGNVARYTQMQPKGSFVNNSNTFTAAAGRGAATAIEAAINLKTGIGGTYLRKKFEGRTERKAAERSLRAGAGLDRLNESRNALTNERGNAMRGGGR